MSFHRPPDHIPTPDNVSLPGRILYGYVNMPRCDHYEQGSKLATVTAKDLEQTWGFGDPECLAEHVAALWGLGNRTWGRVGFRAALERAVHALNVDFEEKVVDL